MQILLAISLTILQEGQGGTRLFRGGVDRKLVKEATGHTSDAVDKYQVTSEEQHMLMSDILANRLQSEKSNSELMCEGQNIEGGEKDEAQSASNETKRQNVGEIIKKIIERNEQKGKTVMKIQIEITHE